MIFAMYLPLFWLFLFTQMGATPSQADHAGDMKTPHTLDPILLDVCEKNIFHFICSSSSRKTHLMEEKKV